MKKFNSIVGLYPFLGQNSDKVKNVFFKSSLPKSVRFKNEFVDVEFNTENIREKLRSVSDIRKNVLFKNFTNELLEAKISLDSSGSFGKWKEKTSLMLKYMIEEKNLSSEIIEYQEDWKVLWLMNLLKYFKSSEGQPKNFFKGVPFEKIRYLLLEGKVSYPNSLEESALKIIKDWEESNKENLSKDFNLFKELIAPELKKIPTENDNKNEKKDFFREKIDQQKDLWFRGEDLTENVKKLSFFIFNLINHSSRENGGLSYLKKHLDNFSNLKIEPSDRVKVTKVLASSFYLFQNRQQKSAPINQFILSHYNEEVKKLADNAILINDFLSVMLSKTGCDFSKPDSDLCSLSAYYELSQIKTIVNSGLISKKRDSHFFEILKEFECFGKPNVSVLDANEFLSFNFNLSSFVIELKTLSSLEGGRDFFSFYQKNDNVIDTIKNLFFSKILIEMENKLNLHSKSVEFVDVKMFSGSEIKVKIEPSVADFIKSFFEYSKNDFEFLKAFIEKMKLSFEIYNQNKKREPTEKTKKTFGRF